MRAFFEMQANILGLLLNKMNRHFTKEDIDGQQVHEKVLNITNHLENANQNQSEISSHTC